MFFLVVFNGMDVESLTAPSRELYKRRVSELFREAGGRAETICLQSFSPDDTRAIGEAYGKLFKRCAGSVLGFVGEVGTGKTFLSGAVANSFSDLGGVKGAARKQFLAESLSFGKVCRVDALYVLKEKNLDCRGGAEEILNQEMSVFKKHSDMLLVEHALLWRGPYQSMSRVCNCLSAKHIEIVTDTRFCEPRAYERFLKQVDRFMVR